MPGVVAAGATGASAFAYNTTLILFTKDILLPKKKVNKQTTHKERHVETRETHRRISVASLHIYKRVFWKINVI